VSVTTETPSSEITRVRALERLRRKYNTLRGRNDG
jgi:hypothetical protein